MIIALSGRAGSGKDTSGSIIQYLTLPGERGEYIGFQTYDNATLERNSPFKIKKFAGKLKTVASLLTGIPIEKFEDQDFKKTDLPNEWVYVENGYAAKNMTVRLFLQKLGTEAMRDGLHTNVWVNALFADYKAMPNKTMDESFMEQFVTGSSAIHYTYPNWIITDMRFPNEIEAVELREGITIRVNRDSDVKVSHSGKEGDFTIEKFDKNNPKHVALKAGEDKMLHPSETALDNANFDYVIENDGTLDELVEKVRAILIREKIIS